ncbi:AIPR family protein [Microcoleus sp. FACHB-53]|nr:AIPR family protein [Microcoleus sp. FACHB-53]
MTKQEFLLKADEFRSLPVPFSGRQIKLCTCFVKVNEVPEEWCDWLEVNPRTPQRKKSGELKGTVVNGMIDTLSDEPEMFALKNQGIFVTAETVQFEKETGGQGVVKIVMTDPKKHGVVNGGHTTQVLMQARSEADSFPRLDEAFVRLHMYMAEDVNPAFIASLAEGLNRSLQVNDPSLENLKGTFNKIKDSLRGKRGEDQIAYRQGDSGDVDITQVLTCLAMFNLDLFPDRSTHPNKIFGQTKEVLRIFTDDQMDSKTLIFDRIIPHTHEILMLSDHIMQRGISNLGKLKVSNAKKGNRARSPKNLNRPAHFAGGSIDGRFHLGWLYPPLAAFRANLSKEAWDKGEFSWLYDPFTLLDNTIDEMIEIVKQEHADNNRKPAEVGRKEAAYRGCYSVAMMELAKLGKLELAKV